MGKGLVPYFRPFSENDDKELKFSWFLSTFVDENATKEYDSELHYVGFSWLS